MAIVRRVRAGAVSLPMHPVSGKRQGHRAAPGWVRWSQRARHDGAPRATAAPPAGRAIARTPLQCRSGRRILGDEIGQASGPNRRPCFHSPWGKDPSRRSGAGRRPVAANHERDGRNFSGMAIDLPRAWARMESFPGPSSRRSGKSIVFQRACTAIRSRTPEASGRAIRKRSG
jgi:hypothetical protein